MPVTDILKKDLCKPQLHARRKAALLKEVAGILKGDERLADWAEETILDALWERENLGTTGFGDGVAIPPCRLQGLESFVLGVGVSQRGVPFDALDGKPVHLFCFLAGPEEAPNEYVKRLAEISVVLRNERARRELMKSPTSLSLYECFLRYSEPGRPSEASENQKLLMLALQEEQVVTDVMELFVEMGIRGAAVIESHSMGTILTTVPLFASFMNFLGSQEEYHRTIFAVVPEAQLQRVVDAIEEITGDLEKHSGALILALDISVMRGSLQSI